MKDPVRAILARKGSQVHAVSPSSSVAEAVALMNRERVGCVLVMEGERPAGIFSERDVMVRVVDAQLQPAETPVATVMTQRLVVIQPETTVEDAMVIVTEERCRHLPVLDGGRVVGLVSVGDLTQWVVRHQRHRIADLESYISGSY